MCCCTCTYNYDQISQAAVPSTTLTTLTNNKILFVASAVWKILLSRLFC